MRSHGRLHDDLALALGFHAPLPPVDRFHLAHHIDAGGEALGDQNRCQFLAVGRAPDRRPHHHTVDFHRSPLFLCCTKTENAVLTVARQSLPAEAQSAKAGALQRPWQADKPSRRRPINAHNAAAVFLPASSFSSRASWSIDALVGDQGLIATIRARKQYDELASELARLRSENAGLREEARRLREDPAAIEEIARRELGLMSPGETLFIIRDIDPPADR